MTARKQRQKKRKNTFSQISTAIANLFHRNEPVPTGKADPLPSPTTRPQPAVTTTTGTTLQDTAPTKPSVVDTTTSTTTPTKRKKTTTRKTKPVASSKKVGTKVQASGSDLLHHSKNKVATPRSDVAALPRLTVSDTVQQQEVKQAEVKQAEVKQAEVKQQELSIDSGVKPPVIEQPTKLTNTDTTTALSTVEKNNDNDNIVVVNNNEQQRATTRQHILQHPTTSVTTTGQHDGIDQHTSNSTANQQLAEASGVVIDANQHAVVASTTTSRLRTKFVNMTRSGNFELFYQHVKIYDTDTCRFGYEFVDNGVIVDDETYPYDMLKIEIKT